ncbi:MAG: DUF2309 domain-containing protein [Gemmataceae bacterium]
MVSPVAGDCSPSHGEEQSSPSLNQLRQIIAHAAHLLPAQGPITVFIHHNTLHAFQDLKFDEAVLRGESIFGCQPYLTEQRYRQELSRGRFGFDDLREVLREDLGERAGEDLVGLCRRMDLRLAMLDHPVWSGPEAELRWYIEQTDALRRVRQGVSAASRGRLLTETRRWALRDLRTRSRPIPSWARELLTRFPTSRIETWDESTWESFSLEALWQVCLHGMEMLPRVSRVTEMRARPRDLMLAWTPRDADRLVHDLLIRYTAAFLDQGMSHWNLPNRQLGFYRCFLDLYSRSAGPSHAWMRRLPAEVRRLARAQTTPLECIAESLDLLGVPEVQREEFLAQTLLALRGWGGMILQIEQRGDRVRHPLPPGTLEEFLAVRLLLDRLAWEWLAREELGFRGPLDQLIPFLREGLPRHVELTNEQRAFPLFQLAQVFGWSPGELSRLSASDWARLTQEVESFSATERRRVFHLAYEAHFYQRSLEALSLHANVVEDLPGRPTVQAITCIDEREESFRRHLEEVIPGAETYGAAGFFGVAMYYRGVDSPQFVPLCPIILQPGHWVEERVRQDVEEIHQRRKQTRKTLGRISHEFEVGSRSFFAGALVTGILGVLASIPLVARILFPRLADRITRKIGQYVRLPQDTRLVFERGQQQPGPDVDQLGYSVPEMAQIGERLLRDIGLTRRFAPMVVIIGHGSDSLNNPHKSAYDCGACGGSPGGPNARALAALLNHPGVRQILAQRGMKIPDDTWFLGGYHNTCDDSVQWLDVDLIPKSHLARYDELRHAMHEVSRRNAHERARRFMSAPLDMDTEDARRHVEGRSVDLAQTRPELGHATNALCIVARRKRTRGLYLDRRAFLVSYDPDQDDAVGSTLERLLGAAVPVCGGINLEYYFSHVDNPGYGCGTKLPHNITSLVGVMDGAASDLRTGLPWQMVEIHEPVRLLFVLETTVPVLTGLLDRRPDIASFIRNEWVRVAVMDPTTGSLLQYHMGQFRPFEPRSGQLPTAGSSVDWYRGWRDHLEFAAIAESAKGSVA